MQAGERQLHLRLHARRTDHPAPRRPPGQVIQQRRLPHSRLAAQHQYPALTCPHGAGDLVEHAALGVPVRQLPLAAAQGEIDSHLTGHFTLRRRGRSRRWHPVAAAGQVIRTDTRVPRQHVLHTGRRRGRPSLSETGESPLLRVRLSRDLDEAITRAAEQAGETRADWIRHTLAQAIRKAS